MEFFEVVKARRSIRKYTNDAVPEEVMEKAIDAALLAPNSSNMQTWGFYWVRNLQKKELLVEACLNQSAAKTAPELLVVTAEPKNWKRVQKAMLEKIKAQNVEIPIPI